MSVRPISVTVVAWILIAFGLFGVLGVLMMALMWNFPLMRQGLARVHAPVPLQIAVGLAGVVIQSLCGLALLFRQNWARFLYVGWSVFALSYAVITSPLTLWLLVPSLVLTLMIVYFLFTPAAKEYFTGRNPGAGVA